MLAACQTRRTAETEAAEAEVNAEPAFKEGDEVWVEDANGNRHPGVFVGMNEAAGWFGGGPSAYVVHPEGHQAEVVSLFRITARDQTASSHCRADRSACRVRVGWFSSGLGPWPWPCRVGSPSPCRPRFTRRGRYR